MARNGIGARRRGDRIYPGEDGKNAGFLENDNHGKTQLFVRKAQEGTGKEKQEGGEETAETGRRPEWHSIGFARFS